MSKPNLLVSFSGGETSGYMTQWILNNWQDKYEIEVVFANTGEEHEETLEFVHKCDEWFGFDTTWVESVVHHNERRGSTHKIVDHETASRDGGPFEDVIKKYGIPNQMFPHCTREMKTNPILSYVKNELGWSDFYTAIGIRADEFDRMDDKAGEKKYLYPLVDPNPTTKQQVNYFWDGMPFRVDLKGYEGNCKACWKKSLRKLLTIADESPEAFDNMRQWEKEYEDYTPEGRAENNPPYRFYRNNLSVDDIFEMAEQGNFEKASDDRRNTNYQKSIFGHELDRLSGCGEHCEPF